MLLLKIEDGIAFFCWYLGYRIPLPGPLSNFPAEENIPFCCCGRGEVSVNGLVRGVGRAEGTLARGFGP